MAHKIYGQSILLGGGDNPLIASSPEEMRALFTEDNIGKFVKYTGETFKSREDSRGDSVQPIQEEYVKDSFYIIVDSTQDVQYYTLPILSNGIITGSQLLKDVEAINGTGNKVIGTFVTGEKTITANGTYIPSDDNLNAYSKVTVAAKVINNPYIAMTEDEFKAFLTTDNIGAFVQYESSIYQVVAADSAVEYHVLPQLSNEGTAADLVKGKELINSNGDKVVGASVSAPPIVDAGPYSVKVLDYDGSVLLEVHCDDGDVITLPAAPPAHDRLVFQEWVANVEVIDNTVTVSGFDVVVGAVYTTASGKNEFDITLTKVTGLTVTLNMDGTKDWGDGTSDTQTAHTYTAYGDYTILCDGTVSNSLSLSYGGLFGQTSETANYFCTHARLASFVRNDYAFMYCYSLETVTLATGYVINEYAFEGCRSLVHITIPFGADGILAGVGDHAFSSSGLRSVAFCWTFKNIGSNAFDDCRQLMSIPVGQVPWTMGKWAFSGTSIVSFTLETPNMTDWYTFSSNHYLKRVVFKAAQTFNIPLYTFNDCWSVVEYDFSQCEEIPSGTLADFSDMNPICKIIVPDNLYDEWIAASNWSGYKNYIYKASEVLT